MRKTLAVGLVLAMVFAAGLMAPPTIGAARSRPPATLWYSEQFVFHSKAVGRDFLIQIARPHTPQAAKAPALYLLDGDEAFGAVAAMAGAFGEFGDTGPAYVIGIAYPARTAETWLALRQHDYVHNNRAKAPLGEAGYGEGAAFERFLTQELRPAIEARYPVDPNHAAVAGHALGGLFVTHMLLNTPGAFDTWLIASPSIWAEPGLLQAAAAFQTHRPAKVFIGVGSREEAQFPGAKMVGNARALADRLRDHASGADAAFWEIPDENHGTMQPAFFSRALRFAFPAPQRP